MPLFGPPNIQKLKEKNDLQGLIKALYYQQYSRSSKDIDYRISAARALGEYKDGQAIDALIGAGSQYNPQQEVQQAISEILINIGGPAVEALCLHITAFMIRDWAMYQSLNGDRVSIFAAKVLGKIGDKRAVEPLIQLFLQNPVARRDATKALENLGDEQAVDVFVKALKKGGIPPPEPDDQTRIAIFHALGEIGGERAVEPLVVAFWNEPTQRANIVEALAKFNDPRVLEPLIVCLLDQNEEIRRMATNSLEKAECAQSIKPLIAAVKALRSTDTHVQVIAINTLRALKNPYAIKPLIGMLDYNNNLEVRWKAADALEMIGVSAVEDLINVLDVSSPSISANAAIVLWHIGIPALGSLINSLKSGGTKKRKKVARILELMADDEIRKNKSDGLVLNALKSLSKDQDPLTCELALKASTLQVIEVN